MKLADTFLLNNIFFNGGFETQDLDFWDSSVVPSLILKQSVDSSVGCRNYVDFLVGDAPIYLEQSFEYRVSVDGTGENRIDMPFSSQFYCEATIANAALSSSLKVIIFYSLSCYQ